MGMYHLKPNHGSESPKYVASFDVETKQRQLPNGDFWLELLCFTMCLSRRRADKDSSVRWEPPRWWQGTTYQEAWAAFDAICDIAQHAKVVVGGHNIGFDWRVLGLDSYITHEGWAKPKPFNTGHPFLVKARRGSTTLAFYSTTNLLPAKLETLAPEFGMKKLGEELDKEHLDDYPLQQVLEYCHMDTAIVDKMQRSIIDLVRERNQGTFSLTIAGQGFHDWLHNDLPNVEPLTIYDSKGLLKLEQADLRGGRCEVDHLGRFEDCTQIDFVSLYPSMMEELLYPVEPMCSSPLTQGLQKMLQYQQDGYHVIAECALELKRPVIGTKRHVGKVSKYETLLFPVGKVFPVVIDSSEIQYLLDHPDAGSIKKVSRFTPYRLGDVGFKTFVARHKKEKQEAKKGTYQYRNAKNTMNSLQGKLAQRYYGNMQEVEPEELPSILQSLEDMGQDAVSDHKKGGIYYHMGEKVYYQADREKDKFAWHAAVRITGKVCSAARMRLQAVMDCAGARHYYNRDTDSLIVDSHGFENLEREGWVKPGVFGKMSIVEEEGRRLEHVDGTIYGNKHYIIDGVIKRKGVKHDAEEVEPLVFRQKYFITGIRSYWMGDRFGVRVKIERKDLNTPYMKGTPTMSGWVEPLVLREW